MVCGRKGSSGCGPQRTWFKSPFCPYAKSVALCSHVENSLESPTDNSLPPPTLDPKELEAGLRRTPARPCSRWHYHRGPNSPLSTQGHVGEPNVFESTNSDVPTPAAATCHGRDLETQGDLKEAGHGRPPVSSRAAHPKRPG